RGYSVKKGCYPGQEIVARTHFLGKAKRALVRLQVAGPVEAGAGVSQAGSEVGRVVCAAGPEALAVLPLDLPADPLEVAGATAEPVPLEGGLAR
ncbi:MAG: folate-binding protein, partial [Gammaproteobacteria bacterium]|nr:folate-binding protein [Gammaproteobacteria bacterium]